MSASTAISVDEYLHNAYHPDCDYVDGEVIERNMGEFQHGMLQGIVVRMLYELARIVPIRIIPELRIRTAATRFRIPDVCVMLKAQHPEPVLTSAPFLCIEILSPEDRMTRVIEKVKEYLAFGVSHVWIVDPATRSAFSYTKEGGREVRGHLSTANPEVSISLPDLFVELDEALKNED